MSQIESDLADELLEDSKGEAEQPAEPEETVVEKTAVEEPAGEAKTESAQAEQEEPTPDSESEPWHITAVLDERDKRKKAEAENAELHKRLDTATPEDGISIFDDEGKWNEQQQQAAQTTRANDKLNMSEALAIREFGKDKVNEAIEWFKTNAEKSPYLVQRFQNAELQHHEIIDMHSEDQARAEMADPVKFKAQVKAEVLAELQAESEAEDKTNEEISESITPSLAKQRSAGDKKSPLLDALDEAFPE